jgi:L-histidine Nalpha-methyltransferase
MTMPRPTRRHPIAGAPPDDAFLRDVIDGLSRARKTIPCKYLYDEEGSLLFDRICDLPEYYLTRCEEEILARHAPEMARRLGADRVLVELGSGSSRKTGILLAHLARPAAYVPVDISQEHLAGAASRMRTRFPELPVVPVCCDYTNPFDLPLEGRVAVFFPGSTIGNFMSDEAAAFLRRIHQVCGHGGSLLVGVDLVKDRRTLEAAYDDSARVTAAFNLNLLRRMNRELRASFHLDRFTHRSFYNEAEHRVEMHLVSQCDQQVRIGPFTAQFEEQESVHTENSYKYTLASFEALAAASGFRVEKVWRDSRGMYSVQHLVAR